MELLFPKNWIDYELIDSGYFEKLERFGQYILIRPEPQAVWDKHLSNQDWESRAHVKFIPQSSNSGVWKKFKSMPDQWNINYKLGDKTLTFRLGLTSFKHVGLFPEQAVNWDFIYESIKAFSSKEIKVLNLFAYTGASSLAASAAGAVTTHVDSVKQVVNWARDNGTASGLENIRLIVDDAVKFVKRELRRGSKYHGIILDPPAFGHGPEGENWKLERDINGLLKEVAQLLDPVEHFLILNTYSLGFSSLIVENLAKCTFADHNLISTGEIFLPDKFGKNLPLGVFVKVLKTAK
ncbi:MAG: class I SAM-dependent methyltransferase [Bacteroidia bacterium]|nr:class I SAM-dependent methyltransferase [Bacteroidia bacterium]